MRIASIDIGTNTFRLLVSELKGSELEKIYIDRVITRLGGGFSRIERLISEDAVERALVVLQGFSRILKRYEVDRVRAVATSVVREALNGHDFMSRVKKEAGIEIELVSGEEEAELTVKGVLKSLPPVSKLSLIFDVGGGSTEYAYVEEGMILGLTSTSLGVVHLAEKYLKRDIPTELEIRAISEDIEDVLSDELSLTSKFTDDHLSLIGTAGTPTTLAAVELGLNEYDPNVVNGFVLRREAVLGIFQTLVGIPREERLHIKGIERGREDTIIPGTLIVLKTMERVCKDEIVVSDGGLLEGIAYGLIT
ncbi:MAG TPA: Ppx/GppA phosphatase family protein [Thermodesulfobacteriota bacterium]